MFGDLCRRGDNNNQMVEAGSVTVVAIEKRIQHFTVTRKCPVARGVFSPRRLFCGGEMRVALKGSTLLSREIGLK